MASGQGTVRENELVRIFDALDFAVIRSPSSGSRTERDQPDVLASDKPRSHAKRAYALESKYGDPPSNLSPDEVDGLVAFAEKFDAWAYIALRYKRDKSFYLVPPGDLERTDSGNYSVPSDPDSVDWDFRIGYSGTGKDVAVDYVVSADGDAIDLAEMRRTSWPDDWTPPWGES